MSHTRTALLASALLVTAGAVLDLIMHNAIIPVPLSAWLTLFAVLWIGFIITVATEKILRRLEQQDQQDEERDTDLMLAALSVRTPSASPASPALYRVK